MALDIYDVVLLKLLAAHDVEFRDFQQVCNQIDLCGKRCEAEVADNLVGRLAFRRQTLRLRINMPKTVERQEADKTRIKRCSHRLSTSLEVTAKRTRNSI